jgi:hypothetical protein
MCNESLYAFTMDPWCIVYKFTLNANNLCNYVSFLNIYRQLLALGMDACVEYIYYIISHNADHV